MYIYIYIYILGIKPRSNQDQTKINQDQTNIYQDQTKIKHLKPSSVTRVA